jgi:ABC-type Fe3+/spermidine/putrescine transport system ATPase subunit
MEAELARRVTGQSERLTVRPERISILDPAEDTPDTHFSLVGQIRDVVYLGADTRYVVSIPGGGDMVVTQQNSEGSASDAGARVGLEVRLAWRRDNTLSLVADAQQSGSAEAAS